MNLNKLDTTIAGNINLLIVDDIENVDLLKSLLMAENFNIFITRSIEKAVQICLHNDISIAIVAMDIPHQNGLELIYKIKSDPSIEHIVVIFTIDHSTT